MSSTRRPQRYSNIEAHNPSKVLPVSPCTPHRLSSRAFSAKVKWEGKHGKPCPYALPAGEGCPYIRRDTRMPPCAQGDNNNGRSADGKLSGLSIPGSLCIDFGSGFNRDFDGESWQEDSFQPEGGGREATVPAAERGEGIALTAVVRGVESCKRNAEKWPGRRRRAPTLLQIHEHVINAALLELARPREKAFENLGGECLGSKHNKLPRDTGILPACAVERCSSAGNSRAFSRLRGGQNRAVRRLQAAGEQRPTFNLPRFKEHDPWKIPLLRSGGPTEGDSRCMVCDTFDDGDVELCRSGPELPDGLTSSRQGLVDRSLASDPIRNLKLSSKGGRKRPRTADVIVKRGEGSGGDLSPTAHRAALGVPTPKEPRNSGRTLLLEVAQNGTHASTPEATNPQPVSGSASGVSGDEKNADLRNGKLLMDQSAEAETPTEEGAGSQGSQRSQDRPTAHEERRGIRPDASLAGAVNFGDASGVASGPLALMQRDGHDADDDASLATVGLSGEAHRAVVSTTAKEWVGEVVSQGMLTWLDAAFPGGCETAWPQPAATQQDESNGTRSEAESVVMAMAEQFVNELMSQGILARMASTSHVPTTRPHIDSQSGVVPVIRAMVEQYVNDFLSQGVLARIASAASVYTAKPDAPVNDTKYESCSGSHVAGAVENSLPAELCNREPATVPKDEDSSVGAGPYETGIITSQDSPLAEHHGLNCSSIPCTSSENLKSAIPELAGDFPAVGGKRHWFGEATRSMSAILAEGAINRAVLMVTALSAKGAVSRESGASPTPGERLAIGRAEAVSMTATAVVEEWILSVVYKIASLLLSSPPAATAAVGLPRHAQAFPVGPEADGDNRRQARLDSSAPVAPAISSDFLGALMANRECLKPIPKSKNIKEENRARESRQRRAGEEVPSDFLEVLVANRECLRPVPKSKDIKVENHARESRQRRESAENVPSDFLGALVANRECLKPVPKSNDIKVENRAIESMSHRESAEAKPSDFLEALVANRECLKPVPKSKDIKGENRALESGPRRETVPSDFLGALVANRECLKPVSKSNEIGGEDHALESRSRRESAEERYMIERAAEMRFLEGLVQAEGLNRYSPGNFTRGVVYGEGKHCVVYRTDAHQGKEEEEGAQPGLTKVTKTARAMAITVMRDAVAGVRAAVVASTTDSTSATSAAVTAPEHTSTIFAASVSACAIDAGVASVLSKASAGMKRNTFAAKEFRYTRSDAPVPILQHAGREIRMHLRLRHCKGVVALRGVWLAPRVTLLLEPMDGGTLHQFIRERHEEAQLGQGREVRETDTRARGAALLVAEVADSVAALHRAGIVHRDIKTHNVMMVRRSFWPMGEDSVGSGCGDDVDDSRGNAIGGKRDSGRESEWEAKVGDLGSAALVPLEGEAALTEEIGTSGWVAPEVLSGEGYGTKADIFSLGVVTWETFVGGTLDNPMCGLSGETYTSALRAGVRPHLPVSMPAVVHELVVRCWSFDPEGRPTADEVAAELRAYAASAVV